MTDRRFSTPGKPCTDFERELLEQACDLEDPWVEIAQMVGLDVTVVIMDRFERNLLSCPARRAFMSRLHRVWVDKAIRQMRVTSPGISYREISQRLGVTEGSLRKRNFRATRRGNKKHR